MMSFATTFAVALGTCIAVTYLYNLIFHGAGIMEWETSFRFAIMMGIVVPFVLTIQKVIKRKKRRDHRN